MTIEYQDALAEVDYILSLTSDDIMKRIPNSFLDFIKKHKSKNHQIFIDNKLSLSEQRLKKETKALISIIYRNYLCPSNQKRRYEIDDTIEIRKQQMKIYSYENIFKSKKKG